jgi:muconolactone D-isomerase
VRYFEPGTEETTMLYCVEMDVNVPFGFDKDELEELKAKEKDRAEVLQRAGKWRHLWRVAGRYANISVFDVADHDELHAIISSLPLFPLMQIDVTPLARHPSAIDGGGA